MSEELERFALLVLTHDDPVVHRTRKATEWNAWTLRSMCGLASEDKGYTLALRKNLHPNLRQCRKCRR